MTLLCILYRTETLRAVHRVVVVMVVVLRMLFRGKWGDANVYTHHIQNTQLNYAVTDD